VTVKFVRPSDAASRERCLNAARGREPTYREIGATRTGTVPPGFRAARHEITLGRGLEVFSRAVAGLQTWQAHRWAGVEVFPRGARIHVGETVVVTVGTPWLALAAPCRIVGVRDAPGHFGFAYGTLPGHPEQGEEAFVLTMGDNEWVRFVITAFCRPGDPLVRLSGPLARGIQARATKGYVRSLTRYVNGIGIERV
jgi:uncharacterized protein (UPF0548 family)